VAIGALDRPPTLTNGQAGRAGRGATEYPGENPSGAASTRAARGPTNRTANRHHRQPGPTCGLIASTRGWETRAGEGGPPRSTPFADETPTNGGGAVRRPGPRLLPPPPLDTGSHDLCSFHHNCVARRPLSGCRGSQGGVMEGHTLRCRGVRSQTKPTVSFFFAPVGTRCGLPTASARGPTRCWGGGGGGGGGAPLWLEPRPPPPTRRAGRLHPTPRGESAGGGWDGGGEHQSPTRLSTTTPCCAPVAGRRCGSGRVSRRPTGLRPPRHHFADVLVGRPPRGAAARSPPPAPARAITGGARYQSQTRPHRHPTQRWGGGGGAWSGVAARGRRPQTGWGGARPSVRGPTPHGAGGWGRMRAAREGPHRRRADRRCARRRQRRRQRPWLPKNLPVLEHRRAYAAVRAAIPPSAASWLVGPRPQSPSRRPSQIMEIWEGASHRRPTTPL